MYLMADHETIPEDTGADFQAPKGAQTPTTGGDAETQALPDPAYFFSLLNPLFRVVFS